MPFLPHAQRRGAVRRPELHQALSAVPGAGPARSLKIPRQSTFPSPSFKRGGAHTSRLVSQLIIEYTLYTMEIIDEARLNLEKEHATAKKGIPPKPKP